MPRCCSPRAGPHDLLRRSGADQIRVVQFTREVADWSPEHFIKTILGPLNPALVRSARNLQFGKDAKVPRKPCDRSVRADSRWRC